MKLMRVISNNGDRAVVELIEANTIERDPNAKPEDFVAALKPGAVLEIPKA